MSKAAVAIFGYFAKNICTKREEAVKQNVHWEKVKKKSENLLELLFYFYCFSF